MNDKRAKAMMIDTADASLFASFLKNRHRFIVFFNISKKSDMGCEDSDFNSINHYFLSKGPIKFTESITTLVESCTMTTSLSKALNILTFLAISSDLNAMKSLDEAIA